MLLAPSSWRPQSTVHRGRSGAIDDGGRLDLGEGRQRQSHGCFPGTNGRKRLPICGSGVLLRTTSAILEIKTALRRFLTNARSALVAAEAWGSSRTVSEAFATRRPNHS
jgi:hypothetical protein